MTGIDRPDTPYLGVPSGGAAAPAGTRCRVEVDDSSAVVRLSGVLDPAAADTVRDALLARLCDRPGPIVADVTRLRVDEPPGRSVFAQVRREVADWPAADLLLCDPAVSGAGRADTAFAGVPAWPTLDGALAALAATPLAAVLTVDLPPTVEAARQARELVATGCRNWGMPALTEPAQIAVTEMVNNVVVHARTVMNVRLAPYDNTLQLSVRDHSPRWPTFAGVSPPTRAGGRGLLLIDTMARRWGTSVVPDGKVIWCVLHPDDEARAFG
ncbi:ATP-binding protein [Micromonospora profundi]|uniref:ATP-binding protein n=1 Tax=Micromonospora profundi TaxID=1420889 RepID=A0AAJ6HZQ8_9ACTN|nr:ATP-binding protein [Micromonospora profundi]WLS47815.1 ATP-binding protein [Micromonospora profundi]